MFHTNVCVFALAGVLGSGAFAQQQQQEPMTVRDVCIKAVPGKAAELAAFITQVGVPLARSRVNSGEMSWMAVARPVVVASTSPQCDYRIVYGYDGLPAEPLNAAQMDAALKRAGMSMSASDWAARVDSISTLVGQDYWSGIDTIGAPLEANNYVRLNHYKVKPGRFDEWVKLETGFWKKLVATHLEGGGKGSWSVLALSMPAGDSLPYNAMTVDIFPDWTSLLRGLPIDQLWPKVHPNLTFNQYLEQLDQARERHSVDVYKITELMRGKTGAGAH